MNNISSRNTNQRSPLIHRLWYLLGRRFRRKRMVAFLSSFAVSAETTILDVGGSRSFWRGIPARVIVVNLLPGSADLVADARDLPFKDGSFDIAFSNSLIEHVGTYDDQIACARELARVGVRYYAQTPNRYFPVEPHFLAPFIHWLPLRWRSAVARFTLWGILTRPGNRQIEEYVRGIRLLSAGEMKALFPDAELQYERFCGMTKSIIARRL